MRIAVLAALALGATVGVCRAEGEVATVAGAGSVSCAEFAQSYQRDPKGAEQYFFAWAQGYMAGVNRGSLIRKNVAGWKTDKQKDHIRAYCNENPLAAYGEAAQSVFDALPNR